MRQEKRHLPPKGKSRFRRNNCVALFAPTSNLAEDMIRDEAHTMNVRKKEGYVRLFVGIALNVALWFVFRRLSLWSRITGVFANHLIAGCFATAALVFVLPVFWRGVAWQTPIAFVLMWLPVFTFIYIIQLLLKYW